jgi:hypothetical protein
LCLIGSIEKHGIPSIEKMTIFKNFQEVSAIWILIGGIMLSFICIAHRREKYTCRYVQRKIFGIFFAGRPLMHVVWV